VRSDEPGAFPKRIAALVPPEAIPGTVSGPVRQLTALARGLQRAGTDCLVVVFHRRGQPPSAFAPYLQEAGVRHCIVEDRGPVDWRLASHVGTVLRRWRPSIVQTHGYKATAVAYLLRRLGAPWRWIGFFHGLTTEPLKARFYHWVDRRLLGAAAAARHTAMNRFSLERRVDAHVQLYRDLLEEAGRVIPACVASPER